MIYTLFYHELFLTLGLNLQEVDLKVWDTNLRIHSRLILTKKGFGPKEFFLKGVLEVWIHTIDIILNISIHTWPESIYELSMETDADYLVVHVSLNLNFH